MSYDMNGIEWGPMPTGVPSLHLVLAPNPNFPGLMQMHVYTDPSSTNRAIELDLAQNIVLTSGVTLSIDKGVKYFNVDKSRGFEFPKVLLVGGVPASGLDGVAYPYNTAP